MHDWSSSNYASKLWQSWLSSQHCVLRHQYEIDAFTRVTTVGWNKSCGAAAPPLSILHFDGSLNITRAKHDLETKLTISPQIRYPGIAFFLHHEKHTCVNEPSVTLNCFALAEAAAVEMAWASGWDESISTLPANASMSISLRTTGSTRVTCGRPRVMVPVLSSTTVSTPEACIEKQPKQLGCACMSMLDSSVLSKFWTIGYHGDCLGNWCDHSLIG